MSVPQDVFGPSVSAGDVAQAALNVLQTPPAGSAYPLLVYYLADRERKAGFDSESIPVPASFREGSDFAAWGADLTPMVVAVAKDAEKPERLDAGTYSQEFELQVGAIVKDPESEQNARTLAHHYGVAVALAILQHANLGVGADGSSPFATSTIMTGFPVPEFGVTATESRNVMHSIATFQVLVAPVLTNWGGPVSFGPDPYRPPGDWPTVLTSTTTVTGEPQSWATSETADL